MTSLYLICSRLRESPHLSRRNRIKPRNKQCQSKNVTLLERTRHRLIGCVEVRMIPKTRRRFPYYFPVSKRRGGDDSSTNGCVVVRIFGSTHERSQLRPNCRTTPTILLNAASVTLPPQTSSMSISVVTPLVAKFE